METTNTLSSELFSQSYSDKLESQFDSLNVVQQINRLFDKPTSSLGGICIFLTKSSSLS